MLRSRDQGPRTRDEISEWTGAENDRIAKGVLVITAAIGILFPLVGASLLAIDRLLPVRWREKLARL